MKFFKAIGKNFKILFRLKTSILAVILGPLIIVLLIGLAFNSSSSIDISIGYTSPDNSTLTHEFVTALADNGYGVELFPSKNHCVDQLEQGLLHTCLIFPEDFKIAEGTSKEIIFVVDKSRVNIVYAVIDSVSEQIGIQSDQLSKSLTDVLLSTLESSSAAIDTNLGSLVVIQNKLASSVSNADIIGDNLGEMDLDTGSIDLGTSFDKLHGYTRTIYNDMDDYDNVNDSFEEIVEEEYLASKSYLNSTEDDLANLDAKLEEAEALTEESQDSISSLQTDLDDISSDVGSIRSDLESVSYKINNIEIVSSDQIVNPITTKIETVTTDDNQLSILFPYALVLIIMFIGMLLSSTLVIIEKKSRATFRVFTTPTRDEFYLITTFVTSFIILAVQISLILIASKYFFIDIITANLGVNICILALTASFFILLGMAIGYAFSTQQATNMASISLGAIFLFISNMILPLETVAGYLQAAAQYNPYVLTSEMLRRSFLFTSSFKQLATPFVILGAYVVGMFILIVLVQKAAKNIYFSKRPSSRAKHLSKLSQLVIFDRKVNSESDFIIAINRLNEEEYEDLVRKQKREIKHFLSKVIHRKNISRKLTKLTKKELLTTFAQIYEQRYHELKVHQEKILSEEKSVSKK